VEIRVLRSTLRALALLPPAVLAIHFFGFAFAHLIAPIQAARNPLYVTQFSREPLLERYVAHLAQALRFDLGVTPGPNAEPIANLIGRAIGASLGLLGIAFTLSVIVGLSLGLFAVRDRPPRIAPWLTLGATLGLATPTFFFGVLGVTAVIMILIWGPGRIVLLPLEGYGWGRHLVLPTLALMLRPTAQIAQVTATMMVGELSKQYIVTARSVGTPERRIVRRHALRNALPAVIGVMAGALRFSAGELIIVETLFYWPGLGRLVGQALIPANNSVVGETPLFLNAPVLGAGLALFAALFLISNLLADLLTRRLDPRLR
jgi:peptide/nickel transport system permease protein